MRVQKRRVEEEAALREDLEEFEEENWSYVGVVQGYGDWENDDAF